jgi:thiol-disulfide isomerase/thioredoxin
MVTEVTMEDIIAEHIYEDGYMSVIMFFGAGCGPCKATLPNYEAVAEYFTSRGAKIKFYKINAWEPDEQKEYCTNSWGINGVPHFKVFFNQEEVLTKIGGGDYDSMAAFIQNGVDEIFKKINEVI